MCVCVLDISRKPPSQDVYQDENVFASTSQEGKTISLDTKKVVIKQFEGGKKKVNVIARDQKLTHSTVSTILKDKETIRNDVKGCTPM